MYGAITIAVVTDVLKHINEANTSRKKHKGLKAFKML